MMEYKLVLIATKQKDFQGAKRRLSWGQLL